MNLKAKMAFLKGVITKRSPIYVQFAVSKNCNLRCGMCRAVEARKNERELTIEEIGRLADVLDRLGTGIVVLTGGEPLLRADLADIVRIFARKGIDVRIQTNGQLVTEERLKGLLYAGLEEATLSLETLDPEKQDAINNKEGSWQRIIRALALFSRLMPVKGNMTGVNTVVSGLNIEEIPKIVKFVTAIGFYSSLIPVHLSSGGKTDFIVRADRPEYGFSEKDFALVDSIYEKLIRMKKEGYHLHNSFRFLKESPNFLKYGKVDWLCDSPNLYFSISPEGFFLPCVDLKGTKSMLDEGFVELFRSERFQKDVRAAVKNCPGCYYACYPEISYFCRDIRTMSERILQGLKISRFVRKPVTYEEALKIAEKIRKED